MNTPDPHNEPAGGAPAGDLAPQVPQPWGQQEASLGPSPSVQATMTQMTERMQTVIDAAERAAEVIRHDAEEQARRHLAEAQQKADLMTAERVQLISELTDDLIRHSSTVRDHSEQMVQALEEAITSVAGKLGEPVFAAPLPPDDAAPPPQETIQHEPPPPGPPVQALPPPPAMPAVLGVDFESAWPQDPPESQPLTLPPEPVAVTSPPAIVAYGRPSHDALLHATRLAVAGNDREMIARVLREKYGLAEPDPIVNRVLGEGPAAS